MLSVYNYYMPDYVSRTPHYSAHKRRELRDIYKNIVKLSASEPLYKIDLSESKQAFVLSIKESALALKDAVNSLCATPLLHTAGVISSSPEIVEASLTHRMNLSDFEKDTRYEIEVESLACGQHNTGNILPSEETPLSEGNYSFLVSIGAEQYSFRFHVNAGSPAFELQSKLSDYINKTGIGLNAQVSYNKELGLSRMELSASQSGSYGKSSFILEDTLKPETAEHGLVEVLGLNQRASDAGNARYSINGTFYESAENTVFYDDTLMLTIHSVTGTPVTVRPVADISAVYDTLEEFTSAYNALVQAGKNAVRENTSSAFLLQGLSHLIASHYSALDSAGVKVGEDGYLSLDFNKLVQAAASGDAASVFREDAPFINSLDKRLEAIILNPMRYVDKKLVAYPDPGAPISERTSPYTTSIYSGMLFNNYC